MKTTNTLRRDPFATLVELTATTLSRRSDEPPVEQRPERRSLLDRLDAWLWRARQRDLERALANATDTADLERRLIDRVGLFGRYS